MPSAREIATSRAEILIDFYVENVKEKRETAIIDILADLRHYCWVHGINFAEQYETAFNHFYEESQNVTE